MINCAVPRRPTCDIRDRDAGTTTGELQRNGTTGYYGRAYDESILFRM